MESEETVLIVGDDISLADLEADVEIGEDPKTDQSQSEVQSSSDLSSLTAFETQCNVFCFTDEPQSVATTSLAKNLSSSSDDLAQSQLDDATKEQCSIKDHISVNRTSSVSSENCHNHVADCDDKSQGLLANTRHKTELSSLDNETSQKKKKRTKVAVNCDKQKLVTVVDSDYECSEDHELCVEMRDYNHINGLHHVMKEAWGEKALQQKHPPLFSLSQVSSCLKGSTQENSISQSGKCTELSDKGLQVVVPEASSSFQGVHRTVIPHPGQIVHNQNYLQTENNYSQHCSMIESLPEEILLKIFSYLSPKELCCHIAPVCQRWHVLAYEPSLWMCLKINPQWEVSNQDICKILERTSSVRILSLRQRSGLTYSEMTKYLKLCHHLTELDLGLCDNIDINVMRCILRQCPQLKNLNVEGCSSIDLECVKLLSTLCNLSHLNLSHCRLENDSVILLAATLHSIVSFNVDGVSWITDDAIIPLCESHKSTLKHLELDGEELTDKSMQAVSQCLGLYTLSVSFCDLLSDTSLEYLKELKNLRKLRLRKGLEFSEEAVSNFFENGHLSHVNDLDMSECAGMKDISVLALTQNCGSHLVSLALRWCWSITDVGLVSIVNHCSNLKILDLTGLHRLSGECLDRVPDEMMFLQFLDLRNCNNINDKLISEMIRWKPDLQVINYYGELFLYGENSTI